MPVYQYSALDPTGKAEKGFAQGQTLEAVVRQLTGKGLTVQQIEEASSAMDPLRNSGRSAPQAEASRQAGIVEGLPQVAPAAAEQQRIEGPPTDPRSRLETDVIGPLVGGVPLKDLHFFFRQFATMLEAGIGMSQALETLSRQTRHPKLKKVIEEAAGHSVAGQPFSVALQRYPEVFSPLVLSMVRAGEQGGFLSRQSKQLADYLQQDMELRNLIRRETAYPKLVVGASIFIIFGANMVIAALAPGRPGLSSPLTTPAVLMVLIPLLIGGWVFMRYAKKNPTVMNSWTRITQMIPGVGGTVIGFAMAKFGRAFGALYNSGVALPKAMILAADACGNENLRGRMYPAANLLEQGEAISVAFESTGAFSPIVMDMIRTGEVTGNVDLMMEKMAEYYEDEGAVRTRQMAMLLGVVCFLAVAAYVLFVVISFYTGYFGGLTSGA